MNQIRPWKVIQEVAEAMPIECRDNIVIIGSLAAAYAYFGNNDKIEVRTKDIDCLLKPYREATEKGQAIASQLLDAGWQPSRKGPYKTPGTTDTPDDMLPAIRLYPPGMDTEDQNAWFIELLTEPESSKDQGKTWLRIVIDEGHYGLPSFRYLLIAAFKPVKIKQLGINYAQPQMMALANLLEHPKIKPEHMRSPFAGRKIKRSNKDLGRVLAIGYLAEEQGLKDFRQWGHDWHDALQFCFPDEWKNLARNAGTGLMELLESDEDMEEAHYTCANGLLSSYGVTREELKEVGYRILGDAVETLEELAEK